MTVHRPLDVSPLVLAHWFHARLCATGPIARAAPSLFGLEVIDHELLDAGGDGARVSFLGEAADACALLATLVDAAAQFDAVALVCAAWASAVPAGDGVLRPGAYAVRRRTQVLTVVTDDGAATVIEDVDGVIAYTLGTAHTTPGRELVERWSAARARSDGRR